MIPWLSKKYIKIQVTSMKYNMLSLARRNSMEYTWLYSFMDIKRVDLTWEYLRIMFN
jgi:hypothetical protein